ncbi:MAG: phage holin family protein [Anaerolineae bacterium]
MLTPKRLIRLVARFALVWFVEAISLLITAWIVPGFTITAESRGALIIASAAALVLASINLLLRPVLLLLALPLGFIPVLIVGILLNAVTLWLTSELIEGFVITGFLPAFVGAFVLAAVNLFLTAFIPIGEDDSFFSGLITRLSGRERFPDCTEDVTGLVLMEIDGLSYWHMQKALAQGWMPNTAALITEQGYVLSRVDCGLPSQTSACQSGIMYGDNFDIPSFRWYDKDERKLFVSGSDAAIINARYSKGKGLMRGGSSINNMLAGDALKSQLTLATLTGGAPEEQQGRARDLYYLFLDPFFFSRAVVLFGWDVIVELWEGFMQRVRNVQPRLNRTAHFYPFIRAATTTLMRDIPAYLMGLDIVRGSPVLYSTYVGYDEVAHHSGPWTRDAFRTLRQYDKVIGRIRDTIAHHAPRPYELIILSDHGQSFGATFKQRYGDDLKEFIQARLADGMAVSNIESGDQGSMSMIAMVGELRNAQAVGIGGRIGRATLQRTTNALDRVAPKGPQNVGEGEQVVVCGSGNLAQVYFDTRPGKIPVSELNDAHPGLVDAIVQHEGIGFVVAYDDSLTPIVLGKDGARNLHTGEVTGEDPLTPYGDPEFRAGQVRRIADFPHSGDLIVNSTLYPDGTVAAMEELVGSHGGVGGEQTDAFILHPADMDVPATANSADFFAMLNARRDRPAPPPRPQTTDDEDINPWAPSVLWRGIADWRTWLSHCVQALSLSARGFRGIAGDPYLQGPALLLVLLGALINTYVSSAPPQTLGQGAVRYAISLAAFAVSVLIFQVTGRWLGGAASYTVLFRTLGFANVFTLVAFLSLIPGLGPTASTLSAVLFYVAEWLGAQQALRLRGWRAISLPIATLIMLAAVLVIPYVLFSGGSLALQNILSRFGWASPP